MAKSKIRIKNIVFNIFAIITSIIVIFVLFNIVTGTKGYAVVSDSMSPEFNKGDVVFSRSADIITIKQGDIVTVQFPDKSGFCTHRVVSVDSANKTITTKGDVNLSPDPIKTKEIDIMGKVWYSVPYLGWLSIWFAKIPTTKFIIILAIIAILMVLLTTVLTKIRRKQKSQTRSDDNEQN